MNHETHVRFVDAHAEGDRRANHPRFIADEGILIRRPLLRLQSRVIRHRLHALRQQRRRKGLRALA
jgi:hypothetical protein